MRGVGMALVLAGCATAPARAARRTRPSSTAVHDAFEAVTSRAERCLGESDRVTVEGFFEGSSGGFFVERVGTASPATRVAVQQCVANAMEQARVRRFTLARHDAAWTVAAREVSAAVRAMMRRDAEAPAEPVLGEVDMRVVEGVIRGEHAEIQRCYEDALAADSRLRGRLEVRFTITVDGRVTHVVASGPPGFRAVGYCIAGLLRADAWPRPGAASVDVSFPFSFAPREWAQRP